MAGRRREHAAYHIEYRCLSGSVGTDKPGNAALLHAQIYILVRVFNEQWDFAFRLAVKPLNPDALQIAAPRAQSADIRPSRGIRSIGYHPMFIGGSGGPWRGRGGNASDTPVGQGTPLVIGTPPDIFNIGISGWSKEQKKKEKVKNEVLLKEERIKNNQHKKRVQDFFQISKTVKLFQELEQLER